MIDIVVENQGRNYYFAYEGPIKPSIVELALEDAGYENQVISFTKTPINII